MPERDHCDPVHSASRVFSAHECFRLTNRQRAQHEGVENSKRRSVDAHSQRQCRDRDGGEGRIPAKKTHSESDVLSQAALPRSRSTGSYAASTAWLTGDHYNSETDMTGFLEARDLTIGLGTGIAACMRLAPDPGTVAELLHDESRTTAEAVASVAEPAHPGRVASGNALARGTRPPHHRERRPHGRRRGRGPGRLDSPRIGGPSAWCGGARLALHHAHRPRARRHDAARVAGGARRARTRAGRCRSTRPRPARRWAGWSRPTPPVRGLSASAPPATGSSGSPWSSRPGARSRFSVASIAPTAMP